MLIQQIIGTFVRTALVWLSSWLVAHGGPGLTDSQIANVAIEATPVLIAIGWSIWRHYRGHLMFQAALEASPGTTPAEIDAKVKAGLAPRSSVGLLLAVGLSGCLFSLVGCGLRQGARPPDVAIAQVGTDVLKAATMLQLEVNRLTAAGTLPIAVGQSITDANKAVSAVAPKLSTALKAYHAATSLTDRTTHAAEVQALITQLSAPLASMIGVHLPVGAARSISGLIGAVMAAVGAVQTEIAKGLQGLEPAPAY